MFIKENIDISGVSNGQKVRLVLYPRQVPDMLYVKVGDKEYNTGFVGENNPYWSLMLATILNYTYIKKGVEIPNIFPKNIKKFDLKTAHEWLDGDDGLFEILGHVVNINWSRNPSKNVNQIDWCIFDKNPIINTGRDDSFEGRPVGVVEFVKENNITSLEYSVYSPIGSTVWDLIGKCI